MTVTTPQDEVRRLRAELEEERANMRAKKRSFTIAIVLLLLIIIGLTAGVVYSLKLRTDIRDTRKHDAKQTELLAEQRELTETRQIQLEDLRADQKEMEEELSTLRAQRDSLQYLLQRHTASYVCVVDNQENGGVYSYYRKNGQFLPTDSWYVNDFELYVYRRVGEYALTDYGFFRSADLRDNTND